MMETKKKVNLRNRYRPKGKPLAKSEPLDTQTEPLLVPFDTLKLKKKTEEGSGWVGEKGDYFYFKPLEGAGENKPIRQIYVNHKFMTGLFRTKKQDCFNGDVKTAQGKKYLLFQVVGADEIRVYEKVQPMT